MKGEKYSFLMHVTKVKQAKFGQLIWKLPAKELQILPYLIPNNKWKCDSIYFYISNTYSASF